MFHGLGYFLLLLLLHSLALVEGMVETQTYSKEVPLAQALGVLLQQPGILHSKTLFIYVQVTTPKLRPELDAVVTRLLRELPLRPRSLIYQRRLEYKPYKHAVLLLVDDLQALFRIYAEQQATSNLSHTLLYMASPRDAYHADVQSALELFWKLSVLNVALVLTGRHGQLQLVTYYPFSAAFGCQVIRANVINRFDERLGRWLSEDFFPAKLNNFYGCTLTCATWEDMPYLVLKADGSFVGIEGSLLQFMANNLNFTVGLYWMSEEQVMASFNETGWIFEEIFGQHADYSLGGFHQKPTNSSSSNATVAPYSQSTYYFMSHIMLVTNLQSAYSTYEKLAFPFNPRLWQAIGAILVFCCLIVWVLQLPNFRTARHFVLGVANRTPYYNLFILVVGANLPSVSLPQRNFARFLLSVWLLATLVLRNAYQSGMYQLLRDNIQRNPPQTIASVLAQQYIIQLLPEKAPLVSLPELKPKQLRFLNCSEFQAFPTLAASSGTDDRLAIITPYEYFGYFRKTHAMSRRLHLVRERIFTQQLSFYVRRHSYLTSVLDGQISNAHSYGFLEHWTSQYVSAVDEADDSVVRIATTDYTTVGGSSGDPLAGQGKKNSEVDTIQLNVLSLKELAALFWLVLWAHLFAIVIFVLEILRLRQSALYECIQKYKKYSFNP